MLKWFVMYVSVGKEVVELNRIFNYFGYGVLYTALDNFYKLALRAVTPKKDNHTKDNREIPNRILGIKEMVVIRLKIKVPQIIITIVKVKVGHGSK